MDSIRVFSKLQCQKNCFITQLELNINKKLHLPLLNGLREILFKVFVEQKKSDQVIPAFLKSHKEWGSRDRRFVAENAYEIVRNKRYLLYLTGSEGTDSLVVKDIIGTWLFLKGFENDSEFFKDLDKKAILLRMNQVTPNIKFSIPDELSDYGVSELGEKRWFSEMEAMDRPAEVFIRTNISKISREKLQAELAKKEILTEIVPETEAGLKVLGRINLTGLEEFKKGLFEIQDAGSQMIVEFLNPQPDTLILDTCAGAGGKSLHLADWTRGKSKIIAMDIDSNKLMILQKRAERNKVESVITTKVIDENILKAYENKGDYLLIDAPCSGLGVIKRNPDTKERMRPVFINEVKQVQQDILRDYANLLKENGYMVYSTCSILPSENRLQVKKFLKSNPGFNLIKDKQIWPSETGFDGFYMALLQKKS